MRLCRDLSSGYGGSSSGCDSPHEVCTPPSEAICLGDDRSKVANARCQWSRWARSQQGNSGLSCLTAAAGSRGSSGSYRGRAHPEGQPAGHLCPLTSVLASLQEGEGKQ